jgi:hypothetical protein
MMRADAAERRSALCTAPSNWPDRRPVRRPTPLGGHRRLAHARGSGRGDRSGRLGDADHPRRERIPPRRAQVLRLGPLGRAPAPLPGAPTLSSRTPPPPTWTAWTSPSSPSGPPRPRSWPRFAAAGATRRSTTRRRGGWIPTSPWSSPRSTPMHSTRMPKGIVANPNCTTMVGMPALKPLHRRGRAAAGWWSPPIRRCRARAWPVWPSSRSS